MCDFGLFVFFSDRFWSFWSVFGHFGRFGRFRPFFIFHFLFYFFHFYFFAPRPTSHTSCVIVVVRVVHRAAGVGWNRRREWVGCVDDGWHAFWAVVKYRVSRDVICPGRPRCDIYLGRPRCDIYLGLPHQMYGSPQSYLRVSRIRSMGHLHQIRR